MPLWRISFIMKLKIFVNYSMESWEFFVHYVRTFEHVDDNVSEPNGLIPIMMMLLCSETVMFLAGWRWVFIKSKCKFIHKLRYSKVMWAIVGKCFLLLLFLFISPRLLGLLPPLFSLSRLIVFDFILAPRLSYWIAVYDLCLCLCCAVLWCNVQWNAIWDGKLRDGSWSWG